MLTHLDNGTEIKLLTMNIKDKEKPGLRRDMKGFVAEQKKPLEIRIGQTRHLHDRYMIDDDGMVIVGTSLNSIGGLKQSFVVTVGEDIRASVLRAFEDAWAHGTTFT